MQSSWACIGLQMYSSSLHPHFCWSQMFLHILLNPEYFFILVINQLDAQNLFSSLNLCTGQSPIGVMIPEAV